MTLIDWSTRIRRHMAELDAEEQRIKEERRDIPKPERPVDVVVEEHEVTFYTMDNEKYVERFIGLYCKGEFVNEYSTRAEAEAARLQFLYDNGVTDKEDFTL